MDVYINPLPPLHSTKQTIKTYKKRNKSFYIVEPCHVVRNLIQEIQKGLAGSQSNLFKITSCRSQADAHELTFKKKMHTTRQRFMHDWSSVNVILLSNTLMKCAFMKQNVRLPLV